MRPVYIFLTAYECARGPVSWEAGVALNIFIEAEYGRR